MNLLIYVLVVTALMGSVSKSADLDTLTYLQAELPTFTAAWSVEEIFTKADAKRLASTERQYESMIKAEPDSEKKAKLNEEKKSVMEELRLVRRNNYNISLDFFSLNKFSFEQQFIDNKFNRKPLFAYHDEVVQVVDTHVKSVGIHPNSTDFDRLTFGAAVPHLVLPLYLKQFAVFRVIEETEDTISLEGKALVDKEKAPEIFEQLQKAFNSIRESLRKEGKTTKEFEDGIYAEMTTYRVVNISFSKLHKSLKSLIVIDGNGEKLLEWSCNEFNKYPLLSLPKNVTYTEYKANSAVRIQNWNLVEPTFPVRPKATTKWLVERGYRIFDKTGGKTRSFNSDELLPKK